MRRRDDFWRGLRRTFPHDAVFVAVIDPTVGSTRKAIIAKSKVGQYFVLPDNGMITQLADRDGLVGAREITNPAWMIGAKLSSTFHGRDIFSPAGAHLARGDDWTEAGPCARPGEARPVEERHRGHRCTVGCTGR